MVNAESAAGVELALQLAREGLEASSRQNDLEAARRFFLIWECLAASPKLELAPEPDGASAVVESETGPELEPEPPEDAPADRPHPSKESPVSVEPTEPADAIPVAEGAPATEAPVDQPTASAPEASEPETPAAAPVVAGLPVVVRAAAQVEGPPIGERVKDLCERVRAFLAAPDDEPLSRIAEAKSLVCEAEALRPGARHDHLEHIVREEAEALRGYLEERRAGIFGAGPRFRVLADFEWRELAQAFRYAAQAERLTALLKTGEATSEETRGGVLHAAAGQALAARWYIDRTMPIDAGLLRLRDDLATLQADRFFIPWWRLDGPDAATVDQITQSAKGIETARRKLEAAYATRARTRTHAEKVGKSLGALADLLNSPGDGDSFEANLLGSIESALGGGIPPSNKELRRLLAGYRHVAERVVHPQGKKLCEYLDKDSMNAIAKKEEPAEPAEVADPTEISRWIEELAPFLRGKTLLLIGGNKGQSHRKNDYKERLGLADVLWPDLEETDKPTIARPQIDKADVVAYIVRFSRHSYKGLLDEAKRAGKTTVTIPRGLGIHTVVRDMHEQLVRRPSNGKETANGDAA
ncbi:MAG: hypothetical protein KIS66_17955 [Fimbriimonadaceae bacterium]|nr:hypothetical protein [Fimbriimonadaceae bacterium]